MIARCEYFLKSADVNVLIRKKEEARTIGMEGLYGGARASNPDVVPQVGLTNHGPT